METSLLNIQRKKYCLLIIEETKKLIDQPYNKEQYIHILQVYIHELYQYGTIEQIDPRTKIAIVIILIGSGYTKLYKLAFEIFLPWKIIKGRYWIVQVELIRHYLCSYLNYWINNLQIIDEHFLLQELQKLLSFTYISEKETHEIVLSQLNQVFNELEDMVSYNIDLKRCFEEYYANYPISKFIPWTLAWLHSILAYYEYIPPTHPLFFYKNKEVCQYPNSLFLEDFSLSQTNQVSIESQDLFMEQNQVKMNIKMHENQVNTKEKEINHDETEDFEDMMDLQEPKQINIEKILALKTYLRSLLAGSSCSSSSSSSTSSSLMSLSLTSDDKDIIYKSYDDAQDIITNVQDTNIQDTTIEDIILEIEAKIEAKENNQYEKDLSQFTQNSQRSQYFSSPNSNINQVMLSQEIIPFTQPNSMRKNSQIISQKNNSQSKNSQSNNSTESNNSDMDITDILLYVF